MRFLGLLFVVGVLCGCSTSSRQGRAHSDPLDAVRIEQMTGNHVAGAVFERTIVCLNARRETHWVNAVTNQSIALLTNVSLSYVTNLVFTVTTNQQQTLATNYLASAPAPSAETNAEPGSLVLPAAPSASTNLAVTTASNITLSKAGNQTSTTANYQTQRNRQFTSSAGNLSLTTADNQVITAETNLVVTVLTNVTLTSVTNVNVVLTNLPVQEHFVVLEYTQPSDFTLAPGESLVLLVDGARHALAPGASQTVIVPRRGFSAVAYKASPQLLVDIANASQVSLRVKGTSATIERTMSRSSRANFKKFLVKYFSPPASEPDPAGAATVNSKLLPQS